MSSSPDMQTPIVTYAAASPRRAGVLYPQTYLWFVFLAAVDLMFTWVILNHGGGEMNVVADWIIKTRDLPGIAAYKFGLVSFVVIVCEIIGRQRPELGAKMAKWAVVLTAFAVTVGGLHIFRIAMGTAGTPLGT